MVLKRLLELQRPYLVIPKLIEQPTWGGQYIVAAKGWSQQKALATCKVGQSYELFSGSNLSLLTSSQDSLFQGELTDRDAVQRPTTLPNAVPLRQLLRLSPEGVLGSSLVTQRGPTINMLIKFTQALGNSFQVHIKAHVAHPVWKPKPESWYFFEPGLITLGVKSGVDWQAYENNVTTLDVAMKALSLQVRSGQLSYGAAQSKIEELINRYDPWQFVNTLPVEKGQVIDLSGGGIHHSWEENTQRLPFGNVLYELQAEAMDDVSTFRNFDKGKMAVDGTIRQLHIEAYFALIDRTAKINNPLSHVRAPKAIARTDIYRLDSLLRTPLYNLDKLTVRGNSSTYCETLTQWKHLFVKAGRVEIATPAGAVTVTAGHSCFVPAAAANYTLTNQAVTSEVLLSY